MKIRDRSDGKSKSKDRMCNSNIYLSGVCYIVLSMSLQSEAAILISVH